MGIGGGEVEEEGFVGCVGEDGLANVGHLFGIAGVAAEVLVEVEDGFGGDVELADLHCAVSGLGHELGEGEGLHGLEAFEFMEVVGVSVLSVEVVVKATEDDGA